MYVAYINGLKVEKGDKSQSIIRKKKQCFTVS